MHIFGLDGVLAYRVRYDSRVYFFFNIESCIEYMRFLGNSDIAVSCDIVLLCENGDVVSFGSNCDVFSFEQSFVLDNLGSLWTVSDMYRAGIVAYDKNGARHKCYAFALAFLTNLCSMFHLVSLSTYDAYIERDVFGLSAISQFSRVMNYHGKDIFTQNQQSVTYDLVVSLLDAGYALMCSSWFDTTTLLGDGHVADKCGKHAFVMLKTVDGTYWMCDYLGRRVANDMLLLCERLVLEDVMVGVRRSLKMLTAFDIATWSQDVDYDALKRLSDGQVFESSELETTSVSGIASFEINVNDSDFVNKVALFAMNALPFVDIDTGYVHTKPVFDKKIVSFETEDRIAELSREPIGGWGALIDSEDIQNSGWELR